MQNFVANITTGDFETGEVVRLDPDLWAEEIEAGFLSPVNDEGDRVIPLEVPAGDAPDAA